MGICPSVLPANVSFVSFHRPAPTTYVHFVEEDHVGRKWRRGGGAGRAQHAESRDSTQAGAAGNPTPIPPFDSPFSHDILLEPPHPMQRLARGRNPRAPPGAQTFVADESKRRRRKGYDVPQLFVLIAITAWPG